ncbi:MAG: MBL fold metallo-hydrolase [Deltaproteobacteria bacterium]|nr:MBL fold metallo-hydrolase [Deltaproteobacteria bacterium]
MYIKCWGSRGSIPVSGPDYAVYGGDTTCLEIRTKQNDIIIIDAGTGIRRLGNKLLEENRYTYHFLFTHAHWDHIMGFPFFKPAHFEHVEFQMYRCPFANKFVETILSKVMVAPYFPVNYADLNAKIVYAEACPNRFEIGSVTVIPISISHPNNGSGYKFVEDDKSFVFLTDNELGFVHPGGLAFKDYLDFCSEADLLIHDAEYTPEEYKITKTWGHSSYADVLNLAFNAGVKQLGLFHLNPERTDKAMDEIVKISKQQIHANNYDLECFAVGSDMIFEL